MTCTIFHGLKVSKVREIKICWYGSLYVANVFVNFFECNSHRIFTNLIGFSLGIASRTNMFTQFVVLHTFLYVSTSTPSSWLKRTRFVPTKIRSSCRSRSRFSLNLEWPWCCIRTHNLFISAKLSKMKSIESLTVPSLKHRII